MAGLTERDMTILEHYAKEGNRELYWNYLAQTQGSDGYGLLALGVVRNDNMPGALANQYAQNQAKDVNGVRMTERQWDTFGQDLVKRDLAFRQEYFNDGQSELALNLPVKDVQKAHDDAFDKAGITKDAWTPRQLLEAARRSGGGEAAAEGVWRTMLDSKNLGMTRLVSTLADTAHTYNDKGLDATAYVARLAQASAEATQAAPNTDPNRVGGASYHYAYDTKESAWYSVNAVAAGMGAWNAIQRVSDPERIRELNEIRALRLETQERAQDFHPQDPHRTLAKSPKTLADAGDTVAPEVPTATEPAATRHAARGNGTGNTGNASETTDVDALFERLAKAAMTGDDNGMRAATRDYAASESGQQWQQTAQALSQAEQVRERLAEVELATAQPEAVRAHEPAVRSL